MGKKKKKKISRLDEKHRTDIKKSTRRDRSNFVVPSRRLDFYGGFLRINRPFLAIIF